MTYRELIDKYKKYVLSDNEYNLECEGIYYIIQEVNNLKRSDIILSLDKEVINEKQLEDMIKRYVIDHQPSQYIVGHTYFYGLKFLVSRDVLIPRFDTEVLVDEVLKYLKANKKETCVDIGTGSGAIAIAIKANIDSIKMDAIDISQNALNVAKMNAKENGVDINFIENDLLNNIDKTYDVIVSNPPYIKYNCANEGVSKMVDEFEPHMALYSPDNGLYHYKKILDLSYDCLSNDGAIFFEIPDNKCEAISEYALKYYCNIEVFRDYHNLRRVLKIEGKKK